MYRALIEFSTGNLSCVHALVAADYPAILINQLRTAKEKTVLQPLALATPVIVFILAAGLKVPSDTLQLKHALICGIDTEVPVKLQALIALCLADVAKMLAIGGTIEIIIGPPEDPLIDLASSAAAGALMTITTATRANRQ